MNKYNRKDNETAIKSIIGAGDTFRGDLNLVGAIRIDGTFIGNITTNNILRIGTSGKGEGIIKAKAIVIGGEFNGELYANEHIILLSNAYFQGNVNCAFIVIEDGAYFSGKCIANSNTVKAYNRLDQSKQSINNQNNNGNAVNDNSKQSNSYLIS